MPSITDLTKRDVIKVMLVRGLQAVLLNATLIAKETAAIYARPCPSLTTKTKCGSLAFTAAAYSSTRPPAIKLLCELFQE